MEIKTPADFRDIDRKRLAGKNLYSVSTANVYDPATAGFALTRGIEEHTMLASKSGLDGIEYWPNNPILKPIKPTYYAIGDLDDYIGRILSAHQSPRGETLMGITANTLRNIPKLPTEGRKVLLSIARPIAAYLLLTDPQGSLRVAKSIHSRIKQLGFDNSHFTINVYPDLMKTVGQKKGLEHTPNKVVQTYPKVCQALGIETPEQMVDVAQEKGFRWCISTYHILRELDGKPHFLNDWQRVVPHLIKAGVVEQIHVEVLRTDMPGDQTKTLQAGKDMVDPNLELTNVKPMLRLIAESWRGHITLEAATGGMKQLGYETYGKVKEQNIIDYYSDYREVMNKIFQ